MKTKNDHWLAIATILAAIIAAYFAYKNRDKIASALGGGGFAGTNTAGDGRATDAGATSSPTWHPEQRPATYLPLPSGPIVYATSLPENPVVLGYLAPNAERQNYSTTQALAPPPSTTPPRQPSAAEIAVLTGPPRTTSPTPLTPADIAVLTGHPLMHDHSTDTHSAPTAYDIFRARSG